MKHPQNCTTHTPSIIRNIHKFSKMCNKYPPSLPPSLPKITNSNRTILPIIKYEKTDGRRQCTPQKYAIINNNYNKMPGGSFRTL